MSLFEQELYEAVRDGIEVTIAPLNDEVVFLMYRREARAMTTVSGRNYFLYGLRIVRDTLEKEEAACDT
jgi:hypothetical protein